MPQIDLQVYYMLDVNNNGQLLNFSGCGNPNVFLGSFLLLFLMDLNLNILQKVNYNFL